MCFELRTRRKQSGVSLDELAAALGSGFSRARLSTAERGLIQLSDSEEKAVAAAITRIGELRLEVRHVIDRAQRVDLSALCSDIREQHNCSRLKGQKRRRFAESPTAA